MIENRIDKGMFISGIIVGVAIAIVLVIARVCNIDLFSVFGTCIWYEHNHIYCLTCGTTRAIKYMVHGMFIKSLYYQPVVLYITTLYFMYMLSYGMYLLSKHRIRYIRLYPIYGYIAVGMLGALCIIRNIALFVWGIKLI